MENKKMENRTYTSLGAELNIPAEMIIGAALELDAELSVLSANGMLLIASAERERQRDLTDALSCFMEEIGYDPEEIYSVTAVDDSCKVDTNPENKTYTLLEAELNIPAEMIIGAGLSPHRAGAAGTPLELDTPCLPTGGELSVLSANGMLLIAAAESEQLRDLTEELGCFMREQGYEPEEVYTLTEAGNDGE
jgi:hypothetical protein